MDDPHGPRPQSSSHFSHDMNGDRLLGQLDMSVDDTADYYQRPRRRKFWLLLLALLSFMFVGVIIAGLWFAAQLAPVDPDAENESRFIIAEGMSSTAIAEQLRSKELIRNDFVFNSYARINGRASDIKSGTYTLSPSLSVQEILNILTEMTPDTITLTFIPGATVEENKMKLVAVGFDQAEVDAAFEREYDSEVFDGKPEAVDLEGYVYPETYEFESSVTAAEVLQRTFEQLDSVVRQPEIQAGFVRQGLTLFEGITLASIIEQEVPGQRDRERVASVFYNRLDEDMPLGSDVTYQYIADKTGQPRSTILDSPYNTRLYKGLPPGPIANPGESALLATANPADTDFLYFVSGDDDVTYFSRTLEEHEANVEQYCQVKCSAL